MNNSSGNPRSAGGPLPTPGQGDDVPCVGCGAVALDTGLECSECGHDNYEAVTGKPFSSGQPRYGLTTGVAPLNYIQPPWMDGPALVRRADALLQRWVELYGANNPQWLPPAGIVNWQEDAGRYLAAHTLPAGVAPAAQTEGKS